MLSTTPRKAVASLTLLRSHGSESVEVTEWPKLGTYIPFNVVVDGGPEQTERDSNDHGAVVEEVGRRRVDESALALGPLEHVLEGDGDGDCDEGEEQDER